MIGVGFAGNRRIKSIEVPDPVPEDHEVIIEMKASGICGSDLHVYRGAGDAAAMGTGLASSEPVIAGHEPAGIVRELGRGVRNGGFRVGARVMVHHYWGCTTCDQCRTGWTQMCETRRPDVFGVSRHGGHAPYLKVPAATLVHLPEELSFTAGAAISCGTGTAFGALKQLGLSGDQTIAIFGQGPVGLAATQLATAMGAKVIALDINATRLADARRLGAAHVVNPLEEDPIDLIRQLTGGRGATCALEASGSPQARIQAIRSVQLWGKVAMVGAGGDVTIDVGRDLMLRQVTVFGSWTFSLVGQLECARFAADRGIDLDAIFSDFWRLNEAEQAYAKVDAQTAGKAVFLIN